MQPFPDIDALDGSTREAMIRCLLPGAVLDSDSPASLLFSDAVDVIGFEKMAELPFDHTINYAAIKAHGSMKDRAYFALVAGVSALLWRALGSTGEGKGYACAEGEKEALEAHRSLMS